MRLCHTPAPLSTPVADGTPNCMGKTTREDNSLRTYTYIICTAISKSDSLVQKMSVQSTSTPRVLPFSLSSHLRLPSFFLNPNHTHRRHGKRARGRGGFLRNASAAICVWDKREERLKREERGKEARSRAALPLFLSSLLLHLPLSLFRSKRAQWQPPSLALTPAAAVFLYYGAAVLPSSHHYLFSSPFLSPL